MRVAATVVVVGVVVVMLVVVVVVALVRVVSLDFVSCYLLLPFCSDRSACMAMTFAKLCFAVMNIAYSIQFWLFFRMQGRLPQTMKQSACFLCSVSTHFCHKLSFTSFQIVYGWLSVCFVVVSNCSTPAFGLFPPLGCFFLRLPGTAYATLNC